MIYKFVSNEPNVVHIVEVDGQTKGEAMSKVREILLSRENRKRLQYPIESIGHENLQ